MAVAQEYSYREHQSTNTISKQTEEITIFNEDKEAKFQAKDELLELVMSKLSSIQREVIQRSYLDNEGEFDYIIAGELHMSDRRLREIKQAALDTLAGMLRLTVLVENSVPASSVV
ncbi:ArpU family phage packaging/lysis transcriptional regulator [Paenibacillus sp. SEL1]